MDKRFWGILGGLVIIAVVLAIIFSGSSAPDSNAKPTENIEGSTKSGLKLVEYGDFQCPYCSEYYPILKQVNSIYDGVIQFQFRNFPLTSIHQNALAAARAAQAAGDQGKYWPMHDLLYENSHFDQQIGWTVSSDPLNQYFIGYAKQLKLNIDKFKKDYQSADVNAEIQADKQAGTALNITGTPSYFLNGKQVKPGISVDAFKQILNEALKAKGIALPAGSAISQGAADVNAAGGQTQAQPAKN